MRAVVTACRYSSECILASTLSPYSTYHIQLNLLGIQLICRMWPSPIANSGRRGGKGTELLFFSAERSDPLILQPEISQKTPLRASEWDLGLESGMPGARKGRKGEGQEKEFEGDLLCLLLIWKQK